MINDNNNNNLVNQRNRRGTGFTNIGKIISANRQNRLGSALQSGVQGKAQDVKTGLEQTSSGFQEQAQSGRLGTQTDIQRREDVLSRFQPTQSGNQNTGFQDVGEEEIKDFERFRSGEYKGPQTLDQSKTQQLRGKAQQAESLGEMTKSTVGRQELLKRFAGGEDYTRGQQRLDNLLLGQTGANQLKQARRGTVGLLGDVSEAEQAASEQAKQYTQEAQKFGQDTSNRLMDMFSQRDTQLEQQAQERLSGAETFQQNILNKLKNEEYLTEEEAAQLGMTPEQAAQLAALQDISGSRYVDSIGVSGMQIGDPRYTNSSVFRGGNNRNKTTLSFGENASAADRYYDILERRNQLAEMSKSGDLDASLSQLTESERQLYDQQLQKTQADLASVQAALQAAAGVQQHGGGSYSDRRRRQLQEQMGVIGNMISPELLDTVGTGDNIQRAQALVKSLTDQLNNPLQFLETLIESPVVEYAGFGRTLYDSDKSADFATRKVDGTLSGPELALLGKTLSVGGTLPQHVVRQLGLLEGATVTNLGYANKDDFEFERYLNKFDPSSVTKETAASQDQLAALNALQRLQGGQGSFDVTKAGTANTDISLNQQVYDDAINKLFGEGQISIDPNTGAWVPQTTLAQNILQAGVNVAAMPFTAPTDAMLNVLGMKGSPAAEIVGDFGEAASDLYGGLSEVPLVGKQMDLMFNKPLELGSKAISGFTESVGKNLSKAVGTVICTELHRQGIMPDDIYKKDVEFGKKLREENPEVFEGYFIWARHIAKLMSKSKLITKIIAPFALAWANQMAGNENKLGKFILKVGVPICGMIGKIRRLV